MRLAIHQAKFCNRKFNFCEELPYEEQRDEFGNQVIWTPLGKFIRPSARSGNSATDILELGEYILGEISEQYRFGLLSSEQLSVLKKYLPEPEFRYFISQSQPRSCSIGVDDSNFSIEKRV